MTEEGREKTCVLSFDEYGCVYMQRHTRAKGQKHACHLPEGYQVSVELYRITYVCMHACVYKHTYVCIMCVDAYVCNYICTYVITYIHMCICM